MIRQVEPIEAIESIEPIEPITNRQLALFNGFVLGLIGFMVWKLVQNPAQFAPFLRPEDIEAIQEIEMSPQEIGSQDVPVVDAKTTSFRSEDSSDETFLGLTRENVPDDKNSVAQKPEPIPETLLQKEAREREAREQAILRMNQQIKK